MPSKDAIAAEEQLASYAQALRHHRLGRRVLWLHLSRHHDQDEARDAAPTALKILRPIVERRPGEIFSLKNGDVVMVAEGVAPEDLQGLRHRIGFLVGETQGEGLISTFDLLAEYERFEALVERALGKAPQPLPEDRYQTTKSGSVLLTRDAKPTTPALPQVISARGGAEIETPVGRRPFNELADVFAVVSAYRDELPRLIARHVALREQGVDEIFLRDPGLPISEGMLTQAHLQAERAFLSALAPLAARWEAPTWLRLSERGVLSPEFLTFTQRLGAKSRPVVALPQGAGPGEGGTAEARAYALTFLKELGIEVAMMCGSLKGLSAVGHMAAARYVEVSIAPADLNLGDAIRAELAAIVRGLGRGRVVLTDVVDQHMLHFGQSVGIVMFRGPYTNDLVTRVAA
ncbi:MAG: hypothetical protein GC199_02060 [Alphaproteobacteria bacterium]|nr:hypothetical protein [Alphaproteobacteria bacterium]